MPAGSSHALAWAGAEVEPATTVVVVCYRPGDWLVPCLESVCSQAGEVVVVDNGSPNREASKLARKLGARTIRSERNRGFAGGANMGLRAANGEVVGLLNDDAVAGPGWLDRAAEVLADPSVAAVTPKVVLADVFAEVTLPDEPWQAPGDARSLGRMIRSVSVGGVELLDSVIGGGIHELETGPEGRWRWTAGPQPFYVPVADPGADHPILVDGSPVEPSAWVRLLNHAGTYLRSHGIGGDFGFGAPDDGRFDSRGERFGFSGTAPVFRAETLRRLGGFAEPFFAYNEDTDWSLRARLAGLRVVYDPRATVVHRLSATSGGASQSRVRFLARRNAMLCLVRNAPAGLAKEQVRLGLRAGVGDDIRAAVLSRLPWALATRLRMWPLRVKSPQEIWDRWADKDLTWDTRPASRGAAGAPTGGGF